MINQDEHIKAGVKDHSVLNECGCWSQDVAAVFPLFGWEISRICWVLVPVLQRML